MKSIYSSQCNCIEIGEGVLNITQLEQLNVHAKKYFFHFNANESKKQQLNYEEQRCIVQQLKNDTYTCI